VSPAAGRSGGTSTARVAAGRGAPGRAATTPAGPAGAARVTTRSASPATCMSAGAGLTSMAASGVATPRVSAFTNPARSAGPGLAARSGRAGASAPLPPRTLAAAAAGPTRGGNRATARREQRGTKGQNQEVTFHRSTLQQLPDQSPAPRSLPDDAPRLNILRRPSVSRRAVATRLVDGGGRRGKTVP
jgi:hypothetical protein